MIVYYLYTQLFLFEMFLFHISDSRSISIRDSFILLWLYLFVEITYQVQRVVWDFVTSICKVNIGYVDDYIMYGEVWKVSIWTMLHTRAQRKVNKTFHNYNRLTVNKLQTIT